MRRTYVARAAAVALALLLPATAAHAGPEHDAAEMSQTVEVAWLMPGPFQGWAPFPPTYLPGGVPPGGAGAVQVDLYKYGTQEMRDRVHALVATGVLNSPEDDSRIATGVYRFVELQPCAPTGPGVPTGPGTPTDPGAPTDPGRPSEPAAPGDRTVTSRAPAALPARAQVALPTYAG